MKQKIHVGKKRRWIAGFLVLAMVLTVFSSQRVSAVPNELTMEDFDYSAEDLDGKMSFTDMDCPDGVVSAITVEGCETYRGIKVGSKLSEVQSKYGDAAKKKFNTKESFNKFIKQYYFLYGNSSKWESYVEYTYQQDTEENRRLRFYLNKNDKVAAIVYIYKYENFYVTNKKVKDIGISFQAPSGENITKKTIDGKRVRILPDGTQFKFEASKVPESGLLGRVLMYDKQQRICGETTTPLSFNWNDLDGMEMKAVLKRGLFKKYNPSDWYYLPTDLDKLGKYNYIELIVYDNDADGGYDLPVKYYFQFK